MKKIIINILLFLIFISLPVYSEENTNPFANRKKTEISKKNIVVQEEVSEDFYIIKKFNKLQKNLNSNMSRLTRELKEGNKTALFILILISFLYGVFHSIGPGHGKCVVCSYLLAEENNLKKGFILGILVAIIHALSAITVASIIYFFIKGSYSIFSENLSRVLNITSYSLITLIGLSLLLRIFYSKLNKKNLTHNHEHEHKHSANCNHDNAHEHSDNCNHKHELENINLVKEIKKDKSLFITALSIGLLPCPGAITILLFTISIDFISIGILLAFFIALGMGLTISLTGIFTIFLRKKTLTLFSENILQKELIENSIRVISALFITLFGLFFLINSF